MQKIFRHKKFIGLTILISMILLNFHSPPGRAVMITTEYVMHQKPERQSDRVRIRAFLGRADVMAQLQVYGISYGEALARTESLTDTEIASIADRIDQLPTGSYALDGGILAIIGLAIYAIIAAIAIYFSNTAETEEKQE